MPALLAVTLQLALEGALMPPPPDFVMIVKKCRDETFIPQAELNQLKMMNIPDSEPGKCFIGCVLEGMGWIRDGKFTVEEVERIARRKMAMCPKKLHSHLQLIIKCNNHVEYYENMCDTGPAFVKCIKTYAQAFGIMLPGGD